MAFLLRVKKPQIRRVPENRIAVGFIRGIQKTTGPADNNKTIW